MGGKEEVWAQKAHSLPFPRDCLNPSLTDHPTRKKHDTVPPQLLNADPLAQIIGTETITDVIIDDVEACTILDSRATADLITLASAKAQSFNIRPMTELSSSWVQDHLVWLC